MAADIRQLAHGNQVLIVVCPKFGIRPDPDAPAALLQQPMGKIQILLPARHTI